MKYSNFHDSRKICKNFVLIISNYWRLFIHLRNSQIVSNICLVLYASTITLKWFIELIQSHQNEFNLDRSHQHNFSKLTAVTVGSVMHSIQYYFWRTVPRNGTEVPQKCFQFSCLFSWGTRRRGLLVFSLLCISTWTQRKPQAQVILLILQEHNKLALCSSKKVQLEWWWNQILEYIPYFHPSLSCVKFVFMSKEVTKFQFPLKFRDYFWHEVKWSDLISSFITNCVNIFMANFISSFKFRRSGIWNLLWAHNVGLCTPASKKRLIWQPVKNLFLALMANI